MRISTLQRQSALKEAKENFVSPPPCGRGKKATSTSQETSPPKTYSACALSRTARLKPLGRTSVTYKLCSLQHFVMEAQVNYDAVMAQF